MIEYKDRRYSLSENLPAPFGGHTTEEFFELRINDLRTYRTAYCIQMGVRANSGIGYEASDDYASFTEEQKALINTTLTLGYNMETGTKYGGSAIDEYIATQILIWLIAHNQLGTGYESQIVDEITANSPAAKPIFYTLRENVMNYRTIPSFATGTALPENGGLYGEEGYIALRERLHTGGRVELYDKSGRLVEEYVQEDVNSFIYQVREAVRCIGAGLLESPTVPHSMTLECCRVFEQVLGA